jgi:hypothetical protein
MTKLQQNDRPLSLILFSVVGTRLPQTTDVGHPLVKWRMFTNVGFKVITGVIMKSYIFWDITPCCPLKVNRCFGVTSHFHLQGRRISPTELSLPPAFTLVSCLAYSSTLKTETISSSETWFWFQRTTTCFDVDFLLGLFFDLDDGGQRLLRNVYWHSRLHNVVSQNTKLLFTNDYVLKLEELQIFTSKTLKFKSW